MKPNILKFILQKGDHSMGIFYWIIFGVIAGGRLIWDIIMGVIGAIIGGFLMTFIGQPGITG